MALQVGDKVRVKIVAVERKYLLPFKDAQGTIVAIESGGVIYPYEVKFTDDTYGVFDERELVKV